MADEHESHEMDIVAKCTASMVDTVANNEMVQPQNSTPMPVKRRRKPDGKRSFCSFCKVLNYRISEKSLYGFVGL